MSRSASRKRARDMKNPVLKGAKLRDIAFKSEMKELSRVGMSTRPEWLDSDPSTQVVGGDRALRGRPRLTHSEKGKNRHVRNQREDVRDHNGRVVHPRFRATDNERDSFVTRSGEFIPVGDSPENLVWGGVDAPTTKEQDEIRVGQAAYRAHENSMRIRGGESLTSHDKDSGPHVHKSTCDADVCFGSRGIPVGDQKSTPSNATRPVDRWAFRPAPMPVAVPLPVAPYAGAAGIRATLPETDDRGNLVHPPIKWEN